MVENGEQTYWEFGGIFRSVSKGIKQWTCVDNVSSHWKKEWTGLTGQWENGQEDSVDTTKCISILREKSQGKTF